MRHQETLSASRPANPNVTENDENVKNAGKRKGGGTSTHAAKSRASDPNVTDKGEHFKDGGKRKGGGTSTHAAKSQAPDPNVTNNAGEHDNDCGKRKDGGTSTHATASTSNSSKKTDKRNASSKGSHAKTNVNASTSDEDNGAEEGNSNTREASGTCASLDKACLHCKQAQLFGANITLHKCGCGKVYHHLCAGKVGHTMFATCYDCARDNGTPPVTNASDTDRRSNLRKELDLLSGAHESLLNVSSELQLCSDFETEKKEKEFSECCGSAARHVVSAWQAWSQSESAPPKDKTELKDLIQRVLGLVKDTRQFSDIDYIRKKLEGKSFYYIIT